MGLSEAILESWELDPEIVLLLLLTAFIYARGWHRLRLQMPARFGYGRLASFLSGLAVFLIAISSPLDAFSGLLLTAHMVQHLLLVMVAPPLILFGAPFLPLLRGLPPRVLKEALGPFLAWPFLQRLGRRLVHPITSWLAFVMTTIAWHVPALYELALRSDFWHEVEHLSFFVTATLFWWPVIIPFPDRPQWPRWAMILYLFFADLQNTALSAFISFYERIIYPTYGAAPRITNLSALEDQAGAGALMWVCGSLAYLVPAGLLAIQALSGARGVRPSSLLAAKKESQLPKRVKRLRREAWDLMREPVLGAIVRWRGFRRAAQVALFSLALLFIADGLWGHQMGSMNLAGILPWTHWRGLAIIALLAAGNLFCLACPFMLTRDLGRRALGARMRWPRMLRSKWLAAGLLALYLWAYEAFDLWDSPWWTAWIAVGYFVASFVIDGIFKGASFCKYVCPIGQFNFAHSLVSPLEVKVRDLDRCRQCSTYDCLRGNETQRGCELLLFQPRKGGNMDCTFCLDCVKACPHDNVGIIAGMPGRELIVDRYRSSIGRLSQRADIAALILLLAFGAFINAAGMIEPVMNWERGWSERMGWDSALVGETIFFALGLIAVPLAIAALCGICARALSGASAGRSWREWVCRFAVAFVPIGASMWGAHFIFHLVTGGGALIPALQGAARGIGIEVLGRPDWARWGMSGSFDWLSSLQLILLDGGLLFSLYLTWRIAKREVAADARPLGLFAPWAAVVLALYLTGVWIIFQPMQMRGMMH